MYDDCTLGTLAYTRYDINYAEVGSILWGTSPLPTPQQDRGAHIQSLELHQNPFNSTAAAPPSRSYFILLHLGTDVEELLYTHTNACAHIHKIYVYLK